MTHLCGHNFARLCDGVFHREIGIPAGRVIWCKTDDVRRLFRIAAQMPSRSFVVVTGDSDLRITAEGMQVAPPNIQAWWGVNVDVDDRRVHALPLGIANPSIKHGNFNALMEAARLPKSARPLYCCHSIYSNRAERIEPYRVFRKRDWATVEGGKYTTLRANWMEIDFSQYVRRLRRHRFVVCPPGNGPDTHRLWEALYLRTIPICRPSKALIPFVSRGLPIALVEDWNDVTPSWLDRIERDLDPRWQNVQPLLEAEFWIDRIHHREGDAV